MTNHDAASAAINGATTGDNPDQQRIAAAGLRLVALVLRKNADYGSAAWRVPKLAPDLEPGAAIRVRMSDKIERLESLLSGSDPQVETESLEDTMRDLAGYCLLWLARPKPGEGR